MPKDSDREPSEACAPKRFAWRCHYCGGRLTAPYRICGPCQADVQEFADEETTEEVLKQLSLFVGPFCVIYTRLLEN